MASVGTNNTPNINTHTVIDVSGLTSDKITVRIIKNMLKILGSSMKEKHIIFKLIEILDSQNKLNDPSLKTNDLI